MPLLWKSAAKINNYIIELDDKSIVFNPASGETHELNLLAIDVLRLLTTPLSLSQLTEQICAMYQIPGDTQLSLRLQKLLEEFDDLGLIEDSVE